MKKTKKIIFLIAILLVSFLHITNVNAEEELTVTVDNNSFEVINNNVTVGDEVTIKVAITSNANKPLESVIVYFTKPVTKANTQSYDLIYNSTSGLYEGKIKIDNTWQNGNYIIERMWFYDGVQSTSRYNSKNPNALWYGSSNYHSVDLSGCSFTVYGTTADAELPAIIGSSLSLSERKTIVGDTVKYEVEITDNVAIKNASIQLYWESGSEMDFETIDLVYNSNTGLYEGYFTITEETVVGTWYVRYIRATDTNNNTKYLYNSVVSMGTYEYAWSSSIYTIRNYGTNPDSKLTISSLSIDDTSITAGETVNISLEAMNYFGISDVKLYYKKDNNDELYMIESLFDKTNSTGSSNGLSWYYNKYVASVTFNDYGYNGKWTLDKIEIISDRNNITTIYNNELHENSETNLSALNFETVGLIDDQNSPTIIDYIIDKDYVYYNDKVKLTINASDDLSGIQNIVANYTLPDGTNKDYILELSEDLYKYEFNYDNQDLNGRYKINYLLAKDKAGNITKITENISQLSFDFYNTITIISPTLYPDMTTSYTLKAYIADNLEIENVVWSSSNTSIASINANTGVMSTKSKEGKVTITATANDGSGIYGTVELIVTNAKVGVGKTTSLGNSNYVGYSSVVWEIEDEGILAKTGKTGYVSINNNYKHNIEVKGLKIGVTNLSMYTPSGDLLASSDVYVYDEISSISSETKTLTLEKNDTTTISAEALYQNGTIGNDELYYYSDNNSIVKIDQKGNVSAIKGGTANIVIYSKNSGVSLTIPVTVNVYSTSIDVDTENVSLNEENPTHQVVYTVLPEDTLNKNVTFKSSNEKIATVTDSGLIQAVRNGTTIITISSEDGHSKKEIHVTVENLKIDINQLEYEDISKLTYTGNNIEPEFVIKDDDYYLVKGTDYTVEYSNNINVGTATALITGINNYKNSKKLEYIILQADPKIKYSSSDKTVSYNENAHGIDLTISSPENVIVKYENSLGEYILDEMPTYTLPGQYVINYQLSINENYTVITGSNKLIINEGQINVTASDYKGSFDGKSHTIDFNVDVEGYEIEFKYNTVDYNNYFYNNYTPNIEETITNQLPTFTNPGYYHISYHITKEHYQDVYGTHTVMISGITGYNKELLKMNNDKLIVRNFVTDLNKIYHSINTVILNSGDLNHYDKDKNDVSLMIGKTGDYMDLVVDNKIIATYNLIILGDVNGDGKISALDYVKIKNHIMGDKKIDGEIYKTSADVNEDGKISALDYVRIKNYIMNGGK